uniref:Uncharacterized protein n=1 Tax=Chromera velia CCMP2878 TaxID=1169474 RepID=A0A0G4GEY0_9ALVE|eukprot:Cvel_21591.t1-p1 / transcript=Cvel_21591.t1 / gene=Cvel_21591 / organism=Chromera_velia_CCMP2878 / gene_product=Ankyrin repeat domain-containing protein 50, putative / transcript_product=Ankyrin repeat domain-containing protein 50, putative / location=Cvel_scaffold2038:20960-26162(-) / protein_length=1219 / sequence_SO=supercontig / SO=protein_coding / is_pseudo=false
MEPQNISGELASGCAQETAERRLFVASASGETVAVRSLLAEGAQVNFRNADQDGRTALHAAARGGHRETAEALVEWGADLKIEDQFGRTPVDLAEFGSEGGGAVRRFLVSLELPLEMSASVVCTKLEALSVSEKQKTSNGNCSEPPLWAAGVPFDSWTDLVSVLTTLGVCEEEEEETGVRVKSEDPPSGGTPAEGAVARVPSPRLSVSPQEGLGGALQLAALLDSPAATLDEVQRQREALGVSVGTLERALAALKKECVGGPGMPFEDGRQTDFCLTRKHKAEVIRDVCERGVGLARNWCSKRKREFCALSEAVDVARARGGEAFRQGQWREVADAMVEVEMALRKKEALRRLADMHSLRRRDGQAAEVASVHLVEELGKTGASVLSWARETLGEFEGLEEKMKRTASQSSSSSVVQGGAEHGAVTASRHREGQGGREDESGSGGGNAVPVSTSPSPSPSALATSTGARLWWIGGPASSSSSSSSSSDSHKSGSASPSPEVAVALKNGQQQAVSKDAEEDEASQGSSGGQTGGQRPADAPNCASQRQAASLPSPDSETFSPIAPPREMPPERAETPPEVQEGLGEQSFASCEAENRHSADNTAEDQESRRENPNAGNCTEESVASSVPTPREERAWVEVEQGEGEKRAQEGNEGAEKDIPIPQAKEVSSSPADASLHSAAEETETPSASTPHPLVPTENASPPTAVPVSAPPALPSESPPPSPTAPYGGAVRQEEETASALLASALDDLGSPSEDLVSVLQKSLARSPSPSPSPSQQQSKRRRVSPPTEEEEEVSPPTEEEEEEVEIQEIAVSTSAVRTSRGVGEFCFIVKEASVETNETVLEAGAQEDTEMGDGEVMMRSLETEGGAKEMIGWGCEEESAPGPVDTCMAVEVDQASDMDMSLIDQSVVEAESAYPSRQVFAGMSFCSGPNSFEQWQQQPPPPPLPPPPPPPQENEEQPPPFPPPSQENEQQQQPQARDEHVPVDKLAEFKRMAEESKRQRLEQLKTASSSKHPPKNQRLEQAKALRLSRTKTGGSDRSRINLSSRVASEGSGRSNAKEKGRHEGVQAIEMEERDVEMTPVEERRDKGHEGVTASTNLQTARSKQRTAVQERLQASLSLPLFAVPRARKVFPLQCSTKDYENQYPPTSGGPNDRRVSSSPEGGEGKRGDECRVTQQQEEEEGSQGKKRKRGGRELSQSFSNLCQSLLGWGNRESWGGRR